MDYIYAELILKLSMVKWVDFNLCGIIMKLHVAM